MDTVAVKTYELIGLSLDWAVAKCEGLLDQWGVCAPIGYRPSTNWAQSGPIIEREGISLLYLYITDAPFRWAATQKPTIKKVKPASVYGPTPLIAAMRCYVASKLGDTVQIPKELAQ